MKHKALFVLLAVLLLCFGGCSPKGQTPAVDDVAQAAPEAGLVEAWEGETVEEAPEEAVGGAHTERMDLYDENGVLCGYDVCEYDELDRVTLEETFDLDGNCTNRWERSYSEDGRECVTHIYSYGELTSKIVTLYDERGMETELRLYDNRDSLLSVSYYDENGATSQTDLYAGEAGAEWKCGELTYAEDGSMKEQTFNPDGSLAALHTRWYDENNHSIRYLCYENGAFVWDQRYAYDEAGNCVRTEYHDANEALVSYELMAYTPEGWYSSREVYNAADELTERKVWEYAEDGRTLSIYIYNGDGQIKEYTLMEYDEQNRIKREETFDPDENSLGHYYYKYAEDGSYEMFSYYGDNRLSFRARYDAEGYLIERIDE